jgi:hypothetical protein
MKPATIRHFRCGEPTFDWTTVWIPDEMTEEEFILAAQKARDAYLGRVQQFMKQTPPNDYRPHNKPHYELQPDRTVSEIRQEWEKKKAVWEDWDKARQKTKPSFVQILCEDGRVQRVPDADISYELDWGHKHGWPIDYDEDKEF